MTGKFKDLFKSFFDSEKVAGLILIICTVVSLSIVNSSAGADYLHWFHTKIDLSFSSVSLNYSLEHWVNDGLMAIFFLLVGLEIERELYIGELSSVKQAILPIGAAVGGMAFPVLIHYLFNMGTDAQLGFAIPMATDIAFALGILALAGSRVPLSVKIFLTALAIIDDLGAIIAIALFYTKTISFSYLIAAFSIFFLLLIFNRFRIRKLFLYLVPGIVMWYCFLQSGVHATISGVLLAFAIPFHEDNDENISYHLQHVLHKPVAFFIVPVFALVNTAIVLPGNILGSLYSPNSIGIIAGLYFGKLLGIFSVPYILVRSGLASLSEDLTWKHLVGIGLLGGIGFTMSMFISNLAFDDPELIISSKLSILFASTLAAITGLIVFLSCKPVNPKG